MTAASRTMIAACGGGILAAPFVGLRGGLLVAAGIFAAVTAWGRVGRRSHPRRAPYRHAHLSRFVPGAALACALLLPPFFNSYTQDVLVSMGLYILLALGLNIHVGLAGMLNLGYIAFYAMGAYTHALMSTIGGIPFWINIAAAGCVSALLGAILCLPTLRLRGDYLAIVTLGFGEMMRLLLNNWDSLTGGPNGVLGIARPSVFGWELNTPLRLYYLVLLLVLLTTVVSRRLMRSPIGRAWMAIREDQTAAEAMGVDTSRVKISAFALGAAVAGVAGAVFSAKQGFVSPESFTFLESVIVLCMVVLGGMGSLAGPIVGASLLVVLPEVLRDFQAYRMVIFGVVLVLLMNVRPQGLLGERDR